VRGVGAPLRCLGPFHLVARQPFHGLVRSAGFLGLEARRLPADQSRPTLLSGTGETPLLLLPFEVGRSLAAGHLRLLSFGSLLHGRQSVARSRCPGQRSGATPHWPGMASWWPVTATGTRGREKHRLPGRPLAESSRLAASGQPPETVGHRRRERKPVRMPLLDGLPGVPLVHVRNCGSDLARMTIEPVAMSWRARRPGVKAIARKEINPRKGPHAQGVRGDLAQQPQPLPVAYRVGPPPPRPRPHGPRGATRGSAGDSRWSVARGPGYTAPHACGSSHSYAPRFREIVRTCLDGNLEGIDRFTGRRGEGPA